MSAPVGWFLALTLLLAAAESLAAPGDTELVSLIEGAPQQSTDPDGSAAGQGFPPLSADGSIVAFSSWAANFVPSDSNEAIDVFVRHLQTGATERSSVSSSGRQMGTNSFTDSISGDGRYVTFNSQAHNLVAGDTNATSDVFVRDRSTGTTTRVSVSSTGQEGSNGGGPSRISRNGRYVTFRSGSTNLVAGDTNGMPDIFCMTG